MKTITLYGLQMLAGLVALAAGYAKLAGMEFMVEPFAAIGLGNGVMMVAGVVEILAGLCLLFPRTGLIGALLLATVMVGTVGATVGSAIAHKADAPAAATFRTSADPGVLPMVVIKKSQGWDI